MVTELLRYGGVAAVALAVDTSLLLALSEGLGVGHLTAAAAGFLAGLAITAVLSERYAFSGPRIASPVLRHAVFAVIGVVGLLLLWAMLWWLVDVRGLALLPAKVVATGVVFAWNFLARRALFSGAPDPGRDGPAAVSDDKDDRDEGVTSSVV